MPARRTGQEQVESFLEELVHPLKAEIEAVRSIILGANAQLTEHIKWKAPSFCMNNADRITFNLHGQDRFLLIFHCGSKTTPHAKNGPLFEDDTKRLKWVTGDRATIKFKSMDDVLGMKNDLVHVINKWIQATEHIK
jgi:hypothetical protein